MERPSWDEYFMKKALLTAERSTCRRHHVGSIVVRDKRELIGGYNGAPSGFEDCLELGCLRDELGIPSGEKRETCRAVHAEENCVAQATLHRVSLAGATVYCTHPPCRTCARLLVQARISEFVTFGTYDDDRFSEIFETAGIVFRRVQAPSDTISVML